jgi:hypothetical protein
MDSHENVFSMYGKGVIIRLRACLKTMDCQGDGARERES